MLGLAFLMTLATGCTERPSAPPLTAEAVYVNDDVGVRFLSPANWVMQSRANLPNRPLQKPIVLVSYQRADAQTPAEFAVIATELAAGSDVDTFITNFRVGSDEWSVQDEPKAITVNAHAATRFVTTRKKENESITREATVFHRGNRAFVFLVTYGASEPASRDAVRTSLESINWSK